MPSKLALVPPIHPGLPEFHERFVFQNPFRHRKDDSLFLIEMTPAHEHRREQQMPGFLDLLGFVNQREILLNQVVLMMKRVAMANLLKGRFQWRNEQFILRL